MNNTYGYLKDVKIIKKAIPQKVFGLLSIDEDYEYKYEKANSYQSAFSIIYNSKYQKYIVTNDIENNGLNSASTEVKIIGFADNLDAAMFVIYEHQILRGCELTIFDEIKRHKKFQEKQEVKNDWEWAEDKKDYRANLIKKAAHEKISFGITSPYLIFDEFIKIAEEDAKKKKARPKDEE